jgi:hypothetical protein
MKLVDNVVRSMQVGKVFRDNQVGDRGSMLSSRFSPIFCEKIGVCLKNRCCDPLFAEFSSVFEPKTPIFFADCFGENIF